MKNYVKRYAPLIYSDNTEMQDLYAVQADLLIDAESKIQHIFENNFINKADLNTIRMLEKIYGILHNDNYTLEQRRTNLLTKIIFKPPYTYNRMISILEYVYGKGNYVFELSPNEYKLILDIDTEDIDTYLFFHKLMQNIMPANIQVSYDIPYTYIYLRRHFTYGSIPPLTYEDLSMYSLLRYTNSYLQMFYNDRIIYLSV